MGLNWPFYDTISEWCPDLPPDDQYGVIVEDHPQDGGLLLRRLWLLLRDEINTWHDVRILIFLNRITNRTDFRCLNEMICCGCFLPVCFPPPFYLTSPS